MKEHKEIRQIDLWQHPVYLVLTSVRVRNRLHVLSIATHVDGMYIPSFTVSKDDFKIKRKSMTLLGFAKSESNDMILFYYLPHKYSA